VIRRVWLGSADEVCDRDSSVRQQNRKMTAELYRSQVRYYEKTADPAVALAMRAVAGWAIAKNELLHFGVALKARLRRLGLVR
jgi:uncharacterized protein YdhG (YjbR/CyaY superfamily)